VKAFYLVGHANGVGIEARQVAEPRPGAGQLVIRVRAASLNRGEIEKADPKGKPAGVEAAGEVISVGEGVTKVKVGDRVMARCDGGFAEQALLDERELMVMPAGLGFEAASALPIACVLSYEMLVTFGRLQAGEWVVIPAASSGVGVACLQLAKAMGARVIGMSGSPEKLRRLAELGLDASITGTSGIAAEIKRLTAGKGSDIAINLVGGSLLADLVAAAAYRGRIAVLGGMDMVKSAVLDLGTVHANRLQLYGVSNRHRTPDEKGETIAAFSRDCLKWFGDGTIKPLIDRVFDFDDAPAAKTYFERKEHLGKVVLRMP
jgi:NADPH:quinone reductase-like Zn-dependent oxidoreductase